MILPGAQGHVGGGTPHIQGYDVPVSCLMGPVESPDHASRGSAEDRAHRLAGRQGGADAASRGLHYPEALAQGALQVGQIPAHQRSHIRVYHHGAGALVLPELGQHLAGEGEERARVQPLQGLPDHLLVQWVQEGEQEADGHCFGP